MSNFSLSLRKKKKSQQKYLKCKPKNLHIFISNKISFNTELILQPKSLKKKKQNQACFHKNECRQPLKPHHHRILSLCFLCLSHRAIIVYLFSLGTFALLLVTQTILFIQHHTFKPLIFHHLIFGFW
jgi:hypothetical protein